MTYAELSTALFCLTPRNPIRDYIRMGDWQIIPAGTNEIEDTDLDPEKFQVWADPNRKVVYVYWPEYAIAMSDLAIDGKGHKEFRDIVLKVHRGRPLTEEEIKIFGEGFDQAAHNEAWERITSKIKADERTNDNSQL